MVGGTIEPAEMLTGVRLVDKMAKGRVASIRLEVWFKNFEDTAKVGTLKENITKCMTLGPDGRHSQERPWGKTEMMCHAPQTKK